MIYGLRAYLRNLAQTQLLAADTLAGANVFLARDTPVNPSLMPAISIDTPRRTRDDVTRGNGHPHFMATTFLRLRCNVTATSSVAALRQLEALQEQCDLVMTGLFSVAPPAFTAQVGAAAAEGTNVLTFPATPPLVWVGQLVTDLNNIAALGSGIAVKYGDGTTITLASNIAAPGISAGDTLQFTPRRPPPFKRIVRIEDEQDFSAEGANHNGEATLWYGFEYNEAFKPLITAPLNEITITATNGPGGTTMATADIELNNS